MLAINVGDLELTESGFESDPEMRVDANWPIHSGTGSMGSTIVYFEIPVGKTCPGHSHTVEETIFIAEGTAEVEMNDERETFSTGGIVVSPALERHVVRNVGDTVLRVVGFFPSTTVVTTFDEVLTPTRDRVLVVPELDEVLESYPDVR
jgi:quercetin dioxygenase-like cupin family protein